MSDQVRLRLQRYSLALSALSAGALLFWTALHCKGCDWFISQTHADIIYTAIARFHEFPYFSWAFNGGSYFIQDPQSNIFSPALPLILLAGPSTGIRLMAALWGGLGVIAFTAWMRRRVRFEAALIGGVASVTSLAVLWRIAAGNDMFLWHLALPALLLFAESVVRKRSLKSMLILGVTLGLVLLGPTFHSITYLFLPVMTVSLVIELVVARPSWIDLLRITLLFLGSCAIALLIASPKLACWTHFTMSRPIGDYGPIPFRSALDALFNFTRTKWQAVIAIDETRGWGVEESAVALQPIGTLFAAIGCTSLVLPRARRSTAIFAMIVIAIGVALSVSKPLGEVFRSASGGNFRVVQRFLYMSSFGLAVFAALGAEQLLSRTRRFVTPVYVLAIGLMLGSALWWTHSAGKYGGLTECDAVQSNALNPIHQIVAERASTAHVSGFTGLAGFSEDKRDILDGVGYTDGFLVVGNDFKPRLWKSSQQHPFVDDDEQRARVVVQNLRIYVRDLKPHEKVSIRARLPAFGVAIRTSPGHAHIAAKEEHGRLVIKNLTDQVIASTTITAKLPISRVWFVVAAVSLFGSLIALSILAVRDSRRARLA